MLRYMLLGMGYAFRTIRTRKERRDDDAIVDLRADYLVTMEQLALDDYALFYHDETWVFAGMGHKRDWLDPLLSQLTKHQLKVRGLSTGPITPLTRGKRKIVTGILSEIVAGTVRIFHSGFYSNSGDYHREMNAAFFERYLHEICPILKQRAEKPALIIDNAPYRGRYLKRMPTAQSPKWKMVHFLNERGVSFRKCTKRVLYDTYVRQFDRKQYDVWAAEAICEQYGVRLLRLPPYHCGFAWYTSYLAI